MAHQRRRIPFVQAATAIIVLTIGSLMSFQSVVVEHNVQQTTGSVLQQSLRESIVSSSSLAVSTLASASASSRQQSSAVVPNRSLALQEPVTIVSNTPAFPVVDKTIRSWGCNLTDSPFVFVHIGKAGGGGARARMSASALNYTRSGWHRAEDEAFYPMPTDAGVVGRGQFCSSVHDNFLPQDVKTFEGTMVCKALNPISQAVACPLHLTDCCDTGEGDDFSVESCHLKVYAGHNVLGNEMHWLPPGYMQKWWQSIRPSNMTDDRLSDMFRQLSSPEWCPEAPEVSPQKNGNVPTRAKIYRKLYPTCVEPREAVADQLVQQVFPTTDWSWVYASMPVVRVTVMREPFSWLMSKFFWHNYHKDVDCVDIAKATAGAGQIADLKLVPQRLKTANGWASQAALEYVLYLCGEDCHSRLYQGAIKDLSELEIQAEGNLRRSFAVVGLLNETDKFYDMIDERVSYMDMSLNQHVKGEKHKSFKPDDYKRCAATFQDPAFQEKIMKASPELAILNRLWKTAVEVNRFQLEDLRTCAKKPDF